MLRHRADHRTHRDRSIVEADHRSHFSRTIKPWSAPHLPLAPRPLLQAASSLYRPSPPHLGSSASSHRPPDPAVVSSDRLPRFGRHCVHLDYPSPPWTRTAAGSVPVCRSSSTPSRPRPVVTGRDGAGERVLRSVLPVNPSSQGIEPWSPGSAPLPVPPHTGRRIRPSPPPPHGSGRHCLPPQCPPQISSKQQHGGTARSMESWVCALLQVATCATATIFLAGRKP